MFSDVLSTIKSTTASCLESKKFGNISEINFLDEKIGFFCSKNFFFACTCRQLKEITFDDSHACNLFVLTLFKFP